MNQEDRKTNPNGANQYKMDPRQIKCWSLYIDPKSKTFGNAMQSALKAGYSKATSNQITTFEWFIGNCRRLKLVDKAEKSLEEALDVDIKTTIKKGEVTIEKVDSGILRVKTDVAKFIAGTQGKHLGYTQKVEAELTGDLTVNLVNYKEGIKDCNNCGKPTLNKTEVCDKCNN